MPDRTQSILLGGLTFGVLLGIVTLFPVIGACLSCLVVVGAGIFSVWHYTDTHQVSITGGQGAILGLGAAALAAIVEAILRGVMAMIGLVPSMTEQQEAGLADLEGMLDPEQMEAMEQFINSPMFMVTVVGCSIVLYGIFGAIGGAIGAAVFSGGDENGGGGPAPGPQPDPSPIPPQRREPTLEPDGPGPDPNGDPAPERRPTGTTRSATP